jgi:hypothetical protein
MNNKEKEDTPSEDLNQAIADAEPNEKTQPNSKNDDTEENQENQNA